MRPPAVFRRLLRHTGGATAIEYGLIAACISLVVIAAVTATGTGLYDIMTTLSVKIAGK